MAKLYSRKQIAEALGIGPQQTARLLGRMPDVEPIRKPGDKSFYYSSDSYKRVVTRHKEAVKAREAVRKAKAKAQARSSK